MLQVLVHDDCTLCTIACYGVGTMIFAHCDCEHGISYYSTYRSFLYGFHFFSFMLSYLQFKFLSMSTYLFSLWVSQFAVLCNCRCKLRLWTWAATRIFVWDTHICRGGLVFTTAKLVLILCSIIQLFSFFSCNQNQAYH